MKVYVVMAGIAYEGGSISGVFAKESDAREDAKNFAETAAINHWDGKGVSESANEFSVGELYWRIEEHEIIE